MKFLSIDLETTGLSEGVFILELAMVPVDGENKKVRTELAFQTLVQCPSLETLKPSLNPFVLANNQELIKQAQATGLTLPQLREKVSQYLSQPEIKNFFGNQPPTILGKSLSALDIPLLKRDLGWDFMRKWFNHRTLDLGSYVLGLISVGILPVGCESSDKLMKHLGMGEVKHRALGDSIAVGEALFLINNLLTSLVSPTVKE